MRSPYMDDPFGQEDSDGRLSFVISRNVSCSPRVTETGAARYPTAFFLTSLPSHRIVPGGTYK